MIYRSFAVLAAAAVLSSCVKDELSNTPHPETGAVVLSADFTERSQAADVPADYMVSHVCCARAESCTMPQSGEKCLPWLFNPGTHELQAWTSCAGMDVADGTAAVEETAPGMVDSMPGYLFTGTCGFEAVKDDTVRVVLTMRQRTRDVRFILTVTEGNPELISSVTGTLSGIAGAFSIAEQKIAGNPVSAGLAFTRSGDELVAAARLLGTAGSSQTLTLEIRFTDRDDVHVVEVDLTGAMSGFNSDMTSAREIRGEVETPIGMDVTAGIIGWKDVAGEAEDAAM